MAEERVFAKRISSTVSTQERYPEFDSSSHSSTGKHSNCELELGMSNGPQLHRFRFKRPKYVSGDLEIDGEIQTYAAERRMQEIAAAYVAHRSEAIVNIGYGLGFAHRVFRKSKLRELILIELNDQLATQARHGLTKNEELVKDAWQNVLFDNRLPAQCSVFFDAFPIGQNFDYSPKAFERYIGEFVARLNLCNRIGCAYFIVFGRGLGWGKSAFDAKLVLNIELPKSVTAPHVTRFMLYEVRRL